MSQIRRIAIWALAVPIVLCVGLFLVAAAVNGVDDALKLTFSAPRNLFCSVVKFCDVSGEGTQIVDTDDLWTRIHDRALLDVGKYETRKDWKAEQTTVVVTHSMRMRATVSVTMVVNLENILPEDIVVDNDAQTIVVTMPPAQPAECFLSDIEYHDQSCLLVCDDLEDKLQENAIESVLDSDELDTALTDAYRQAQPIISGLLAPVARGYTISYVQRTGTPPRIESSSCN